MAALLALIIIVSGCSPAGAPQEGALAEQDGPAPAPPVLAGTTTQYIGFSQAGYEQALAEGKTILLYFYANWCPICKAEEPEISAAFSRMGYADVVGFRVNYRDSDTDSYEEGLARQFGITYQHTKVVIKGGERVLKSPDSWDTQRYLDEIGALR